MSPQPSTTTKQYVKVINKKKVPVPVATKKYVKRAISARIERKDFNVNSITNNTFSRDGLVIPLFANVTAGVPYTYKIPAQGAGDGQRDGDIVHSVRLHLNLRIVVGTSPDILRVIIFRWKPKLAMDYTFTSLVPLINYESLGQDYLSAASQRNNKHEDYVIMYDKLLKCDTYSPIISKQLKMRLPYLKHEFTGDGSATSHSMTNQIFLCLIGEGAPTNAYMFTSRIEYEDA